MEQLGIPQPASLPLNTALTDQFIAADGLAMVKGMINADMIGLQTAIRPDVALLYHKMLEDALLFGGKLLPLALKEGWVSLPPAYPSSEQRG